MRRLYYNQSMNQSNETEESLRMRNPEGSVLIEQDETHENFTKLGILGYIRRMKTNVRDVLQAITGQELLPIPQHAFFGSVEVTENVGADLLTPADRNIYKDNFHVLQEVTAKAPDSAKLVLTSARMMSGIVGIHPMVDIEVDEHIEDHTGDARTIVDAFKSSGVDFDSRFSLLSSEHGSIFLLNDEAAKRILQVYQADLGTLLPAQGATKEQLHNALNTLFTGDPQKAHTAFGLLSGISAQDVREFVASEKQPSLFRLNAIKSNSLGEPRQGLLRTESFGVYVNPYLDQKQDGSTQGVSGFGVSWRLPFGSKEHTIRHCQKLLQINRELGLTSWFDKSRTSLSVDTISQTIASDRSSLSSKQS